MAKGCALCNRDVNATFPLSFTFQNILLCPDCRDAVHTLRNGNCAPEKIREALVYAADNWKQISNEKVKEYLDGLSNSNKSIKTSQTNTSGTRTEPENKNLIITTAHNVDGYTIVRQGGLVFGETFYKVSFGDSLKMSVAYTFTLLKFRSSELTGVVSLLEKARQYALEKMEIEAVKRGCNAIIGVDFESSSVQESGRDLVIHVTVYGTAVQIAPNETGNGA